ncbi:temporarily Assigned name family member [Salpingoeca rosetta]|uniref:Temporarily Assigned name family member n=1 Tax=Salpingoeca rosetta (strain ATCC 50818 / BSB-021) TaxID=946362 RepID=F2TWA1_SALR5|nr:temporarily Assigned name family member [Salpingoeca rosetta]EGD72347.1 temporarily Assigned name family member [Salpingoeca rosetta]|eukprot:XP_004998917.1 temporarily Assigned name family member [Salpingoeca rosetta]
MALLGFAFTFAVVAAVYYFLILAHMPPVDSEDWQHVKLPRDLEDTKALARVLLKYRDDYYMSVLILWMVTYIIAQSFCIPVTIFFCILSGTLFSPSYLALLYVCAASAFGATGCYLNSKMFLKDIVSYYFPRRCAEWRTRVEHHKDNLLFFVIFLRATPFLPNWFINVASPVIGVNMWSFWLGTFIGVAPPCLLYVEAGGVLEELTSTGEVVSLSSILRISALGCLALLPVLFKDRLKRKFD